MTASTKLIGKKAATALVSAPTKTKPAAKKALKPAVNLGAKATRAATPEPKAKVKVEAAAVALVSRIAKAGQTLHLLAESGGRPTQGRALFAHTHAALTILGLLSSSRPAIPKGHLLTVMGQRAVTYHLKQVNFEETANNRVRLTTAGYNAFTNRAKEGKVDTNMANGFVSLFLDGTIASDLPIRAANVFKTSLATA